MGRMFFDVNDMLSVIFANVGDDVVVVESLCYIVE